MKSEFQAKFLMHLNQKKQNEGFTLIELLVVIIIIGILAAIALPSLLGQANKAKQSEARQNVGSINRAQQAFALGPGRFTDALPDLGLGIKTQTTNYLYTIKTTNNSESAANWGLSVQPTTKTYVGLTGAIVDTKTNEALTVTATCESVERKEFTNVNSAAAPPAPGNDGVNIVCDKAPTPNGIQKWKDLKSG
ncbi:type IV pilin-like G/H family protein [Lusitaniella coriacea LEGE 07157]|uniref:Type IV pilin-like G/H family protein n=1 Tax=Lusitaniella coriacea LEGE 07157 TaxID=945747 RepID=A0A8J7AXX8_9CYAN|nr:type IV pilin-like G/H family protein [Lusitaniella coriacea]MBE9114794.1 type IV pilin-like G/H family protein [Lusitaniella coriacea LEGE 07157]